MDLESNIDRRGPARVPPDDRGHNEIANNGSCANDIAKPPSHHNSAHPENPPPPLSNSPGGISPPTTKGYGLKKWRRIRRDVAKDSPVAAIDSSKILKRLLPGNANPSKAQHSALDTKLASEPSVGSPNALNSVDGFPIHGSVSDSRIAAGSVFAAGTDSENSEDRSSKSSTAASAPKARYDLPAQLGHAREKNKVKGMAVKNLGGSSQRATQGKWKAESTKKARGERVKIEKENSQSSIESDSRSSNLFFIHGTNATSNGKQTGRSTSYDGENSDEAHASERHFDDEVQTGYNKENAGEVEDSQDGSAANVSWGVKEAKNKNKQFSTDRDPLVESILSLQSVQEALVKEVQKLAEIEMEPMLLLEKLMEDSRVAASSTDWAIQEPKPLSQLGPEKTTQTGESSLQAKVLNLEQNVKLLECKLDEARTLLVEKESKVAKLEAAINGGKSPKEELGSTRGLRGNNDGEIENELEGLFKQRIEAEIEYLAITRATQSFKVVAGKQATLLKEQESVAEEQAEMLNKLGDAENKAAKLKKDAQELENYCGDIVGTEEVLVTQRGVCKFTWCFFTQLMLLVLALWIFVLKLSPNPGAVVPT